MGNVAAHFVLLGAEHENVIDELKDITEGSTFLYEKEHELQNVLMNAYSEMAFVVRQFQTAHADILTHGTPELSDYIAQINNAPIEIPADSVIELDAVDLSTYFKSFLLLTKAVLDKLVPLYSYRYYDSIKQFSDKGARLIRAIKNNKRVPRQLEMIALLEENKAAWIDGLIDLRDEYAHYSSLRSYQNFVLTGERANQRGITNISDFEKPSITIKGVRIDALEYMHSVKIQLIAFLNKFLLLCEFTPGRRPKHYLNCECGHVFAKRNTSGSSSGKLQLISKELELKIKNRELDYAVIICPKCRSTTDTDLKFWRDEGFSFTA